MSSSLMTWMKEKERIGESFGITWIETTNNGVQYSSPNKKKYNMITTTWET